MCPARSGPDLESCQPLVALGETWQRQWIMPHADTAIRSAGVTRGLLRCGAAAGPLFVATFLVEGAARVDYDPRRHPVSSLALGPRGTVQVANFLVAGALYTGYAVGLARVRSGSQGRLGPILVGAAGAGLVGAGVFRTDPVSGYPPGTPDRPTGYTRLGRLHDVVSVPTFLGIPAASFVYARAFVHDGRPAWALYSAASGGTMLATVVAASAGFGQARKFVGVAGLFQRISVTAGFGWLTALAIRGLADLRP